MKVLVYLPEKDLTPAGGPLAVGYYYYQEILKNQDNTIDFIKSSSRSNNLSVKKITRFLPKWMNNFQRSIRKVFSIKRFFEAHKEDSIDYGQYDLIHFHQTGDMYEVRRKLESYKGLVILQSHSPMPWYQEQMEKVPVWGKYVIKNYSEKFEYIDRYAFERADYLLFPCPEAEEPYAICWPYFTKFKESNNEKFKYVLTGINASVVSVDRDVVLSRYGIPQDSFVISYVGRHNLVKGFDLLKEIAIRFFERNNNAYVLSAGSEFPIKRLKHIRWKEIGFTKDPHSIIAASDVFVLPNRMTYFDIVMIEILSLGKIVVASKTGGNRYFEGKTPGVFLYESVEEAVDILEKIHKMSKEELLFLGNANYEFYKNELTSKQMYLSYKKILASL